MINQGLLFNQARCLFTFLIFCSCSSNSKKDASFMSLKIEYFENGKVKYVSNKTDDSLEVVQTVWFDSSGKIDYIENEKNDQNNGQIIWLRKSGNVKNISSYLGGEKDGAEYTFYQDGSIKNHIFWRRNKKVGYATDYKQDSIGTLKHIYFFDADTVQWTQQAEGFGISTKPIKSN
jgi:antitoxin component YwqK of YwqJK toxin-antitoxin module